MLPRFIIKTHTQALRPGNYSVLVTRCTFPDKSAYPEHVERRLADFLKNKSAAKYTVLTATEKNRGFGFLSDNMIWSWRGHVINTILRYQGKQSNNIQDYLELSEMERITYLKYFLETEGALILKLAKISVDNKELSYSYLKNQIQNIFEEIYEAYIGMASDLRSRMRIKEMFVETKKQMKSKEHVYDEGTLRHKIEPHIEALSDLGLLAIYKENQEEIYRPIIHHGIAPLTVFSEALDNFDRMEEIFLKDSYFSLIAQALNLNSANFSLGIHKNKLKQALLYGYDVMKDKVTGMVDINALMDWCRIKMLSEDRILSEKQDVKGFFDEMRMQDPASIRYHVDGKGRIAYLILSKDP